jgi:hypothetical protein
MARANAREVRPNTSGIWQVRKPGGRRSSGNSQTQGEAVARAREILRRDGGGELRIAGLDGAIRQADTILPGHDPRRSPG